MFRSLIRPAIGNVLFLKANQGSFMSTEILRKFSQFSLRQQQEPIKNINLPQLVAKPSILTHPIITNIMGLQQQRNYIKFSLNKGKRKSVGAILKRFKRLEWGTWIRTIAGKNKRIWKKSLKRRYRCRQHVFTNSTQSHMLDKMTCSYWHRPKHYIDDPYRPYHSRENFVNTRKKPIEWDL